MGSGHLGCHHNIISRLENRQQFVSMFRMKLGKLIALFHTSPAATAPEAKVDTSNPIHCATHGPQPETFVCQHIAEGLLQRERVGFFWTQQDPTNPFPDAWCSACEERVRLTDGEWVGEAGEHLKPKIMCGECYEVAKAFHMGGDPWH